MNLEEVMLFLKEKGNEQTVKIYRKHGASCEMYGVKVADLKVLVKKIKTNHKLAMQLYATSNSDAQYLAGLIADPLKFSKNDFLNWMDNSHWYMTSEYSIAWNLAENPDCMMFCKEWINSKNPVYQEVAWAAMSSYLMVTPNENIEVEFHKKLIEQIVKNIHISENRVRYTMNGYLIALGASIPELTNLCKAAGDQIGIVNVEMGQTSCKVPDIRTYIEKIEQKGKVSKKKKTAKC